MTTTDPAALYREVETGLAGIFAQFDIAEEEIARASKDHPEAADRIYHAFTLYQGTHPRMELDWVYRAHVRELTGRMAAGGDMRLATSCEIALACSEASLVVPFRHDAAALYFRVWRVFPDDKQVIDAETMEAYERTSKNAVDDLERQSRYSGRQEWRRWRPKDITCDGKHHGDQVESCEFWPAQGGLF